MGHPTSETKQDTECRWLINYAPADAETDDQLSGWLTKAYPVTDDDRWASLDPRTQIEFEEFAYALAGQERGQVDSDPEHETRLRDHPHADGYWILPSCSEPKAARGGRRRLRRRRRRRGFHHGYLNG
jgi:hypothetical protein